MTVVYIYIYIRAFAFAENWSRLTQKVLSRMLKSVVSPLSRAVWTYIYIYDTTIQQSFAQHDHSAKYPRHSVIHTARLLIHCNTALIAVWRVYGTTSATPLTSTAAPQLPALLLLYSYVYTPTAVAAGIPLQFCVKEKAPSFRQTRCQQN